MGKILISMFTFLEIALNLDTFTHAPPLSLSLLLLLALTFLLSHPRQREINLPPPGNIFSKIFPRKHKTLEEAMIFFKRIQSVNMKMTWNIRLFIFGMIYNCFK